MKKRSVCITLIIVFLAALMFTTLPFLSNDIFFGAPDCAAYGSVNLMYFGNENKLYDFAVGTDGTMYLLSDSKFFAVPADYGAVRALDTFVKASIKQSNIHTLPKVLQQNLEYNYPLNLLSEDDKTSSLYFALNGENSAAVYKYDAKRGVCTKVLSLDRPVVSVSAHDGNVLVSSGNDVFVSYGGGSFEKLASRYKLPPAKDIVCFTDKQNGIYYQSFQGFDGVLYSTDCFKNTNNTKHLSFPLRGEGMFFKAVPLKDGKACLIKYPFPYSKYKTLPECYIADVRALLKMKNNEDGNLANGLKTLKLPEQIHTINDALYWKNHFIFATNNGIWTYDLTFRTWYHHKFGKWYGSRVWQPCDNIDFNIKKMIIKNEKLVFFVDSPNLKGIYTVSLKRSLLP